MSCLRLAFVVETAGIEPAVAVKLRVRPGSASGPAWWWKSGGRRCCSAAAGGAAPTSPPAALFGPMAKVDGVAAGLRGPAKLASSARATAHPSTQSKERWAMREARGRRETKKP